MSKITDRLKNCRNWLLLTCLLVAYVIISNGCSPKYYAPNTQNVPLLQEKEEMSVSVASGNPDFELQGAYAVSDNIGVLLNLAAFDEDEDEDGDGGNGNLIEAGVGYFKSLSPRWVFETYALIGTGHLENNFPSTLSSYPSTTGKLKSNLKRIGFQPAIGFKTKYGDMSASTRITLLAYSDISGSLIFGGEDQVMYLKQENRQLLFEPAITLRAGYDFVKLQIQLGTSINLTNPDFRQDKGYITIGAGYYLDKK